MRALFTSAVVWSAMVWYAVLELHLRKVRRKNRMGFIKTTLVGVSSSSFLLLVKRLPMTLTEALRNIRSLGRDRSTPL
jgi:hypothetical protein